MTAPPDALTTSAPPRDPPTIDLNVENVARIHEITLRYGSRVALDQLTLSIPGGCVGLLGPNGAGKTTLLKTLLGFLRPASGSATVLGLDVASQSLQLRQQIGLMPELECHIPGMNAVTFVAYAGELSGMPSRLAMSRAHEVLEYCGLGEARYRDVETYSTGMKQRIKLAQALVHGPRLVFLDEPTNGLDPAGRDEMLGLVRGISRNNGVNVVVSSHLLPDIERVCDSVVVMRSGRVVMQGTIDSLRVTNSFRIEIDLQFDSPEFRTTIQEHGGKLIGVRGAMCLFDLPSNITDIGRLLFETARATGAQVRGYRPAQRSLEDIFMGAVE